MPMKSTYSTKVQELLDFPLSYRFMDEEYNKLPDEVIKEFRVIKKADAKVLRSKYIAKEMHLCEMKESDIIGKPVKEDKLDWADVEQGRLKLESLLSSTINNIYVFWNSDSCLKIPKNIFLQYWDDFLYPDDDNTFLLFDNDKFYMTYVEENICLYSTI